MSFWENNICTFVVVQNEELLEKPNTSAVVLSMFKREEYYKHFGIYRKGLKRSLQFIEEFNAAHPTNSYILVMFIDSNIYKDNHIMSLIKNKPFVVAVTFSCANFKQGEYHLDLFGTLVRFFPMFDFPNNPIGCTIIIDVDLHEDDIQRVEQLMIHKPSGLTAAGVCYPLLLGKNEGYIYAGSMCINVDTKYDRSILNNFIQNAHTHESLGYYKKRTTTFGYGVDEIFLNEILLPIIKSYNISFVYQISYILFHAKKRLFKNHAKTTEEVFSYLLGKYDIPNSTVDEKYTLIDSLTYHVATSNEKNSYIVKRFYDVIEYCIQNKKKWLPSAITKFIHENLQNVISAIVIVHTDSSGDIKNTTLYDAIYTDD